MAAKEPGQVTYEAWHRARLGIPDTVNAITWEDTRPQLKAAWAAAEQAASERAWDEGWEAHRRYADGGSHETNPYRLPKGPTK